MLPKVSEKDVQTSIVNVLTMRGALAMRVNSGAMAGEHTNKHGRTKKRIVRFITWFASGHPPTSSGVSDVLACYRGRFVAIEVKAPGKKKNATVNQKAYIDAVLQAEGIGIVADCVDDVIELLDWLDGELGREVARWSMN